MALPQWRKNQIAVTISSAFLNFGYTLVMSFLPIYVRELGVQTKGGIALWERIDSRFEPYDDVSYWTTMGTARGPKRHAASCHPGNSGKQRFLGADGPGSECMAGVRAAHCARAAGGIQQHRRSARHAACA